MRRLATLVGVALVVTLMGCSADGFQDPPRKARVATPVVAPSATSTITRTATSEPQTRQAVRVAAERLLHLLDTGPYGQAWRLLTDDTQDVITRRGFFHCRETSTSRVNASSSLPLAERRQVRGS